jgi:SAM-dependent methyltransferase
VTDTNKFTGKADAYAAGRPGYAAGAIDFICGLLPIGAAIADVGAGTGKFTQPLAARGCEIFAVEPNGEMRGKIVARSNLHVIDGTAEATGLADQSVDAVTCAQAFHWFDPEGFRRECQRILRPGGRVFVIYNRPVDERHDEALAWWNSGETNSARTKIERRLPDLQEFFGPGLREERFPHTVVSDAARWEQSMLSHSVSPLPGDAAYDRFIESVRAVFARCQVDGTMSVTYETIVYTA